MDFADVTTFFNDDPIHDAYTGAYLFSGHSKAQNAQLSAGATTSRRTLTTAPDVVAPARDVITMLGDPWIMGTNNVDGFQGEAVRRVWSLKKSTGLVEIVSPAQACAGAAGYSLHVQKEMSNNTTNSGSFSDKGSAWDLYAGASESAARGKFVRDSTGLYRIFNLYRDIEGFLILETEQFDADALQSATFTLSGVPDLVTDKLTTSTITLPVIQSDSLKFYRYRTQVEADSQPGDRVVFVAAASAAPKTGAVLTMLGANWRVLSAVIDDDARALRVRLV